MAGRASIVGAAVTHVGNVREHNEDAHFFDADLGMFVVCDGMGGHAAGEVASAIAIKTIRERWADAETQEVADVWLARGTAIAKKQLLAWLRDGVIAAHQAIIAEAERDQTKSGMGTTLVAGMIIGSELIFAHAGDSRAYLVRGGISTQLTEDHTLLQRLLAAGIDVDVSGDGARFRSMLTNALGIGQECKVSTFVVPLADGDRFMLCSDGISEYVEEAEVGEVLTKQPSPARAAQKLVDLALERGGGDNATAVVVRVLEAGDNPLPAEQRRRDDLSISLCDLWTEKVSPQQRLRAMRIAIAREHAAGEKLPAHSFGDRVAWIVVEGEVNQAGEPLGPGSFIYPESLVAGSQPPANDALAVARTEVRAVAIRNDDFKELCEEDPELGETLQENLVSIVKANAPAPAESDVARARTDPSLIAYAATLPPGTPVIAVPTMAAKPPAPVVAAPVVAAPVVAAPVVAAPVVAPKPAAIVRPALAPVSATAPTAPAMPAMPAMPPIRPLGAIPSIPPMRPSGRVVERESADSIERAIEQATTSRHRVLGTSSASSPQIERPEPEIEIVASAGLSEPEISISDLTEALTEPVVAPPKSTEPEMEVSLELEADLPPDDAAPDRAASDEDSSEMAEITVSTDDGNAKVIETVTDTSEQTLTVTLEEPTRHRPVTADDAVSISGTIEDRPRDPANRSRRLSDGWGED